MRPIHRLSPSSPRIAIVPDAPAAGPDPHREPGRALVAVPAGPAAPRTPRPVGTGSAAFLAQLIAIDQHLPQTRARRRADPDDAVSAYAATPSRRAYAAIAGGAVSLTA